MSLKVNTLFSSNVFVMFFLPITKYSYMHTSKFGDVECDDLGDTYDVLCNTPRAIIKTRIVEVCLLKQFNLTHFKHLSVSNDS